MPLPLFESPTLRSPGLLLTDDGRQVPADGQDAGTFGFSAWSLFTNGQRIGMFVVIGPPGGATLSGLSTNQEHWGWSGGQRWADTMSAMPTPLTGTIGLVWESHPPRDFAGLSSTELPAWQGSACWALSRVRGGLHTPLRVFLRRGTEGRLTWLAAADALLQGGLIDIDPADGLHFSAVSNLGSGSFRRIVTSPV